MLVTSLWFESNGTRLFAEVRGNPGGVTVIMLHGGLADHRSSLPLIESLDASRFQTVLPDLRASGRSHWSGELGFEQMSDDLVALLDQLGTDASGAGAAGTDVQGMGRAIIGGVSSGSSVALHFALRHPDRTLASLLITPIHAGSQEGLTETQTAILGGMSQVASRALSDGIDALKPLYARLPQPMRDKALAMIETFDPASVVTTSDFLASGAQPFETAIELEALRCPVLLVPGEDDLHPATVADLWAAHLENCTVARPSVTERAAVIAEFCDRVSRQGA